MLRFCWPIFRGSQGAFSAAVDISGSCFATIAPAEALPSLLYGQGTPTDSPTCLLVVSGLFHGAAVVGFKLSVWKGILVTRGRQVAH